MNTNEKPRTPAIEKIAKAAVTGAVPSFVLMILCAVLVGFSLEYDSEDLRIAGGVVGILAVPFMLYYLITAFVLGPDAMLEGIRLQAWEKRQGHK